MRTIVPHFPEETRRPLGSWWGRIDSFIQPVLIQECWLKC